AQRTFLFLARQRRRASFVRPAGEQRRRRERQLDLVVRAVVELRLVTEVDRRIGRLGCDGGEDGEERHLLLVTELALLLLLDARLDVPAAKRVPTLLGDAGCMAAEAWVVGDEEPRTLPRHAARPADEATNRLAE